MSNNVDNRVVNLQFNNAQFEAGVRETLNSLDELKKALQFNTSVNGINTISNAVSAFNVSNMANGVDTIASKFTNLGLIGQSVINNLTTSAISFGRKVYQNTIGQITSGGWSRASKSAQARFTLEGILGTDEKGMANVEKAFDNARNSVNDTAYTLDNAVSIASQLVASGVEVGDTLEKSLTGLAGVAATTGASYEVLGNVWVDTASAGVVTGDTLSRLQMQGLNAKKYLAEALHTTTDEVSKMASKGQISFEQFSNAMNDAFGEHAKDANRTFSGVTANIKAQLSKIGEVFASGIIENSDVIDFLNSFMDKLKEIKNYIVDDKYGLQGPFKNLMSTISKLGGQILGTFKLDSIGTFVDYIRYGINYLNDFLSKFLDIEETVDKSVENSALGEMVETLEYTTEHLKKAHEIWEQGLYGNGQDRKNALKDEYQAVQNLVNAYVYGGYSWEAAEAMITKSAEDSAESVENSANSIGDSAEKATNKFSILSKVIGAVKSFGTGIKSIFSNIKTTVIKLWTSFKKTFNFEKFLDNVKEIADAFSEFIGYFELTEERSDKMEIGFTGVWSALSLVGDMLTTVSKIISKVFGPVLGAVTDLILTAVSHISNLIKRIKDWYENSTFLKNAIEYLSITIKNVIVFVKEFFTELSQMPVLEKIKTGIINLGKSISEKLGPYFGDAKDKVTEFFDNMNAQNSTKIEEIVSKINDAIDKMISFIDDGKVKIEDFTNTISEKFGFLGTIKDNIFGINDGMSDVNGTMDEASKKEWWKSIPFLDQIIAFAKSIGAGLIEKIKGIQAWQVVLTGFGAALIILALNINSFVSTVKEAFSSFGEIGEAIKNMFDTISSVFVQIKKNLAMNTSLTLIKNVAILIGVIAASIFALANTDTKKMLIASGVLTTFLALITGIAIAIIAITKKTEWTDLLKFTDVVKPLAILFIALSVSITLLAIAIAKLSTIETEGIWIKFAVLASTIILVSGLAIAISKIAPVITAGSMYLVGYAASVYILILALTKLNEIDVTGIKDKLLILGEVIFVVGIVATAATRLSGVTGTVGFGLLAVVASILLLEITLNYIIEEGPDMNDVKNNLNKFLIVFSVLALVIVGIQSLNKAAGSVIGNVILFIGIAYSLKIIVTSLVALSAAVRHGGVLPALFVLAGIFGGLLALIALLNKSGPKIYKASAMLLSMAGAVAIIAIIAGLIGNIPILQLAKGILIVALIMTMIGAFTIIVSKYSKGKISKMTAMLMSIAGAVSIIAVVASLIGSLPLEQLAKGLGVILIVMTMLGAFVVVVGKFASGTIDIKPLIALAAAVVAIGLVLALLTVLTNEYTTALVISAVALGTVLVALAVAFKVASDASSSIKVSGLLVLISSLVIIGAALAALTYFQTKGGSILKSALAIIMVLAAITAAYYVIADNFLTMKATDIGGLTVLVGSLVNIALALKMLNEAQMNGGSLLKSVVALVIVLGALTVGLSYLSQSANRLSIATVLSLVTMIFVMRQIAKSLNEILSGEYSWSSMIAAALSMSIVMATIVGMLALLSRVSGSTPMAMIGTIIAAASLAVVMLAFSVVMSTFAKSIKVLIECVEMLTKIDYSAIKIDVLMQLCGVVAVFGVAATIASVGVIALAIGFSALAVGALIFATAVAIATPCLIPLIDKIKELALSGTEVAEGLEIVGESIVSFLTKLGVGIATSINQFILTLALYSPIIKMNLIRIMKDGAEIVSEGVNSVIDILLDGLVELFTKLEEKLPVINEKINNVIIIVLENIASHASIYGYYGVYIAAAFVYGLSKGFVDTAPMLGETLSNIINGLYMMFESLISTLIPSLKDTIESGILDLSEALWGLLAATGNDAAEEQYQIIIAEKATRASQQSEEIANAYSDGFIGTVNQNKGDMADAVTGAVGEATDQTDIAEQNAENTSGSFLDRTIDSLLGTDGGLGDIKNSVSDYLGDNFNFDLSGGAESSMSSFTDGLGTHEQELKYKISDLNSTAIDAMKNAGWKESGEYLVREVQDEIDDSSWDFTSMYDTSEDDLLGAMDDTSVEVGTKGETTGKNYSEGVAKGISDNAYLATDAAEQLGADVDAAARSKSGLDEQSPSKKGYSAGEYYSIGIGNGISDFAGYVKTAAINMASNAIEATAGMMNTISSIMSQDDINWQPTLTPVIDSSQLQNDGIFNSLFNPDAINVASNTAMSVTNASENTLANQVAALSEQVKKMAETDYSKLLEGVAVNIDNSTTVDGTALRQTSARYTIKQVNNQQQNYAMAIGGRI